MNDRFFIRWCASLFLLILIFGTTLHYTFFQKPDLSSTISPLSYQQAWDTPSPSPAESLLINTILKQTFTYLSEGGQSYVFLSADQQYVLKLFKFYRMTPHPWIDQYLDFPPFQKYRTEHINKRKKRLHSIFEGHKLAYKFLKKESFLLAVHLNPTQKAHIISIIDSNGKHQKIDLNQRPYVLQKKGEMLKVAFKKDLAEGNLEPIKHRIQQLFTLYLSEYRKGLYDYDHGIMHNIGYLENELFHLDVGRLTADERMKDFSYALQDLTLTASKIKNWIRKKSPKHFEELSFFIEKTLDEIVKTETLTKDSSWNTITKQ